MVATHLRVRRMRIEIDRISIDEETLLPVLNLKVQVDAQYLTESLEHKGKDDTAYELGLLFLKSLEKVL